MKRSIVLVSMLCAILLCSGCATVGTGSSGVDPERFGRLTTVTYLATKDKMEEKHVEAIKQVYSVFDALLSVETDEGQEFKSLLLAKLAEEVGEDDEEVLMIINEIVDMYWEELVARYGNVLEKYSAQIKILREFNKGIKAALEDYEFMNN